MRIADVGAVAQFFFFLVFISFLFEPFPTNKKHLRRIRFVGVGAVAQNRPPLISAQTNTRPINHSQGAAKEDESTKKFKVSVIMLLKV